MKKCFKPSLLLPSSPFPLPSLCLSTSLFLLQSLSFAYSPLPLSGKEEWRGEKEQGWKGNNAGQGVRMEGIVGNKLGIGIEEGVGRQKDIRMEGGNGEEGKSRDGLKHFFIYTFNALVYFFISFERALKGLFLGVMNYIYMINCSAEALTYMHVTHSCTKGAVQFSYCIYWL